MPSKRRSSTWRPGDEAEATRATVQRLQADLSIAAPPNATVEVEGPPSPQKSTGLAMARMLMFWLCFVVLAGLLPILLRALTNSFWAHRGFDLTDLLGSGELLPIAAVIGGATIGEVFESGRREQPHELNDWKAKLGQFAKDFLFVISLIGTLLCVIFSVFIYGILLIVPNLAGVNSRNWSEALFLITIISSAVIIGSVRKL